MKYMIQCGMKRNEIVSSIHWQDMKEFEHPNLAKQIMLNMAKEYPTYAWRLVQVICESEAK